MSAGRALAREARKGGGQCGVRDFRCSDCGEVVRFSAAYAWLCGCKPKKKTRPAQPPPLGEEETKVTDEELDELENAIEHVEGSSLEEPTVSIKTGTLIRLTTAARRWAKAEALLRAHGNEIVSIIRDHYYAEHSRAQRALEALLKEASHGE